LKVNKLSWFIVFFLLFVSFQAQAGLEISVDTDKTVYQSGEDVVITITAFNPTTEPITLTSGFYFTTYIIDGVYNWAEGKSGPDVIIELTIGAGEAVTWDHVYGVYERDEYLLGIGVHTVVGEVRAFELQGQSRSNAVEFEVIPEPASMLLLGCGAIILRKLNRIVR
jgi:hypothetical protein